MVILTRNFQELEGDNVEGVLVIKNTWPSIARTVWKDHNRWLDVYLRVRSYPSALSFLKLIYLFSSPTQATSTLVMVPSGTRMDTFGSRAALTVCTVLLSPFPFSDIELSDVINVSGHRLSTAEIESALILYPGVAEAAVIGAHDELTGQAVHAFVTLKRYVIYDRNVIPIDHFS